MESFVKNKINDIIQKKIKILLAEYDRGEVLYNKEQIMPILEKMTAKEIDNLIAEEEYINSNKIKIKIESVIERPKFDGYSYGGSVEPYDEWKEKQLK